MFAYLAMSYKDSDYTIKLWSLSYASWLDQTYNFVAEIHLGTGVLGIFVFLSIAIVR